MIKTVQYKDTTWVDIQDPKLADVQYLEKQFGLRGRVLEELIPPAHRAKIEHHEQYLFMILYDPALDKKKKEIFSRELDIIVSKDRLITSHYVPIEPVNALFDEIAASEEKQLECMTKGAGHLLFCIIKAMFDDDLEELNYIERKIDYIEQKMFRGEEKKMVFEISVARRDIIDFRRILAPQATIMDSLKSDGPRILGEELSYHFQYLRDQFEIVEDAIEDHKETIQGLAETNQALLTTKINEIIQILTVLSVIFLPITLTANLWGMNFDFLPLTHSPFGFWVIAGTIAMTLLGLMTYFKKKKWL
ncbi:MAG: magnesium transporter CorA family protein [Candidatus Spechtbacterales bacterium]